VLLLPLSSQHDTVTQFPAGASAKASAELLQQAHAAQVSKEAEQQQHNRFEASRHLFAEGGKPAPEAPSASSNEKVCRVRSDHLGTNFCALLFCCHKRNFL